MIKEINLKGEVIEIHSDDVYNINIKCPTCGNDVCLESYDEHIVCEKEGGITYTGMCSYCCTSISVEGKVTAKIEIDLKTLKESIDATYG